MLTGATAGRHELVRLVVGPDGRVWPDAAARLPGRGAWVVPDRAVLAAAIRRGRLRAALARAFRSPPPEVPEDLLERIEAALAARALDRLGLEHRAGRLVLGAERIARAARAGRLILMLHAADAAEDGVAKLEQALRSGGGDALRIPAGRERLSHALGRDNSVHIGVADPGAARRIRAELARWLRLVDDGRALAAGPARGAASRTSEGRA
ncbi:MAG: DUF448 domain-containing protein [Sphingomonadaceae bacterium]|uniref:DUF448 domain-containing protein n=1 Tax=Thermaurantiacus sp. TaxID=2820283 RepID=UPI00298EDC31|nr:DUF448 domain-containing protein [Thermaurantiacus sp.]MCS6987274.1 DUF448 domain-containing protein [Sphingomonadaceae bacterium]MDW8414494.1 DUF448 domain-containing protein [Thermaurantiacus sp.]